MPSWPVLDRKRGQLARRESRWIPWLDWPSGRELFELRINQPATKYLTDAERNFRFMLPIKAGQNGLGPSDKAQMKRALPKKIIKKNKTKIRETPKKGERMETELLNTLAH